MADQRDACVQLLLRPDRRQRADRRADARGGRRLQDLGIFDSDASPAVHAGHAAADDVAWPARRKFYVH